MNLLGNIFAGGIVGLGVMLAIWSKLRQADTERARADSLASWIGGKQAATASENAAAVAAQHAADSAGVNPLDW